MIEEFYRNFLRSPDWLVSADLKLLEIAKKQLHIVVEDLIVEFEVASRAHADSAVVFSPKWQDYSVPQNADVIEVKANLSKSKDVQLAAFCKIVNSIIAQGKSTKVFLVLNDDDQNSQ